MLMKLMVLFSFRLKLAPQQALHVWRISIGEPLMFLHQDSTSTTPWAMNWLVILLRFGGEFYFASCGIDISHSHLLSFFFVPNNENFHINSNLLALHRIATLRHDELGQVCHLAFYQFNVSEMGLHAWFSCIVAGNTSEPLTAKLSPL